MAKNEGKKKSEWTNLSKVHVQNYGLFWSDNAIDWDNSKIEGRFIKNNYKHKRKADEDKVVNFWTQTGIYVLYQDFTPIYVGQTGIKKKRKSEETKEQGGTSPIPKVLGGRLTEHYYSDDLVGKWNKFSWFGFKKVNADKTLGRVHGRGASGGGITYQSEVHLLEAVLISIFAGNIQNKQDGGWKSIGVHRFDQVVDDEVLEENDPILRFTNNKFSEQMKMIKELTSLINEIKGAIHKNSEDFGKKFPTRQYGKIKKLRIKHDMDTAFEKLEGDILSVGSDVRKIKRGLPTKEK